MKQRTIFLLFLATLLLGLLPGCTAHYGYQAGRTLDERNHSLREITIPRLELLPQGTRLIIVRNDTTVSQGFLLSYSEGEYVELSKRKKLSLSSTQQPLDEIRRIYLVEEPKKARTAGLISGLFFDLLAPFVVALILLINFRAE